jgi:hypothetical protein
MKTLKRSFKLGILPVIVAIILLLGIQSPSHAIVSLKLFDGTTTVTIVDEGGGDTFSGLPGVVGYNGTIGIFTGSAQANSKPFQGSASDPFLHANAYFISPAGGGGDTLQVFASEIGFTASSLTNFLLNHSVTTAGSVTFNYYADSTNTIFGTDTPLGAFGPYSGGSFSDNLVVPAPSITPPYALTLLGSITHGNEVTTTSYNQEIRTVPEPTTLILFGSGLLGAALYRRLRKPKG